MQVVVISHNQIEKIPLMLESLKGHSICYVLDRCTDGSNSVTFPINVKKVINREGFGFLAGKMRDIGASSMDINKPILFLDGDKVPQGDLSLLENLPYSAVCLGVQKDPRPWIQTGEGPIPWGGDFMNPNNDVYSCGIYLTPLAMLAAKKHSKQDRIFNEAFDGVWGEEDRYLGDILHMEGLTIGYTSRVILSGSVGRLTPEKEEGFSRNWIKRLRMSGRIETPPDNVEDELMNSVQKASQQRWFTNTSTPLKVTLAL